MEEEVEEESKSTNTIGETKGETGESSFTTLN